jgi:type I restriction enzyme S subunit
MSEWKEYMIGDIVSLEYGKSLQDYRNGVGKYDVFGTNGKIGLTNSYLFDKCSVIIGRKGAYREVHLAKSPFYVIDTAFYTKNKINDLNTLFLYYWFKNVDINSMDSGSAIPSTSRGEIYELDISLPPLPEQHAIATILSSLDDKIDLLHRQNATLEAMAEAVFRQWFVVEGKEEWEEGTLGDLVEFNYGKTLRDLERSGSGYPVYGSSGVVGYHSEYYVMGPGIITGRKGTLGVINYSFDNFFPIDIIVLIDQLT